MVVNTLEGGSDTKVGGCEGTEILISVSPQILLMRISKNRQHTIGSISSKYPFEYNRPMEYLAINPPSEYPTTDIFLIFTPSFSDSLISFSISHATRSPQVSMPSYVCHPAVFLTTRMRSFEVSWVTWRASDM